MMPMALPSRLPEISIWPGLSVHHRSLSGRLCLPTAPAAAWLSLARVRCVWQSCLGCSRRHIRWGICRRRIASDAAGNAYLIGGTSDGSLDFNGTIITNPTPGRATSFLAKFDPTNNVNWHKVLASPRENGSCWGYAVATASCGEVWISGAMAKARQRKRYFECYTG
jgi:hypothetical protein